jgi:hypothetical protein
VMVMVCHVVILSPSSRKCSPRQWARWPFGW